MLPVLDDLLDKETCDRRENLDHESVNVPEQMRPLHRLPLLPAAVDSLEKIAEGCIDPERKLEWSVTVSANAYNEQHSEFE